MKRNIQSDETPFAAFLLVRVRVRRVVFTDHVFRVRERVPTDAGFFRPLCGGANGRFASFFREFFLLDGREFFSGEGWVRGESSNRHGDERDSRSMGKNFENLASTSRRFVVCRRALFFALSFSSSFMSSLLSYQHIVSLLARYVSSFGRDSTITNGRTIRSTTMRGRLY